MFPLLNVHFPKFKIKKAFKFKYLYYWVDYFQIFLHKMSNWGRSIFPFQYFHFSIVHIISCRFQKTHKCQFLPSSHTSTILKRKKNQKKAHKQITRINILIRISKNAFPMSLSILPIP